MTIKGYIPISLLDKLTDNQLVVYLYLQFLSTESRIPIYVNKHTVAAGLGTDNLRLINTQLVGLEAGGYLIKERGTYTMPRQDINFKKDHYTSASIEDLQKLVQAGKTYLLPHLLRMYASRDSKIEVHGQKYIIGHMPLSYFASVENLSELAVGKQNKELEKLEILYIHHTSYGHGNNLYCAWGDKNLLKKYVAENTTPYRSTDEDKNYGRSIMAKYRWAMQGKEYSDEEIAEINQYIKDKKLKIKPVVRRHDEL